MRVTAGNPASPGSAGGPWSAEATDAEGGCGEDDCARAAEKQDRPER